MENQGLARPLSDFANYSAIGFDVDHCLTKYRVPSLTKLIYDCTVEHLLALYNYPKEVFETKPFGELLNLGLTELVVDLKNGNLIKLGVSNKVLRAFHGLQRLSDPQIKQLYGEERILEGLNPYCSSSNEEPFIIMTLFDNSWGIIFALCIEFKENHRESDLSQKSNLQIKEEIFKVYDRIFRFWDYQGKCAEMQSFSLYYRDIYENVEKYVFQQEETVRLLKHIKSQGKFLFIASNSPYVYAKLTLDYSLGKNWEELFDLIICKADKPKFFTDESSPFYEYDQQDQRFRGEKVQDFSGFKKRHLVEGNSKLLGEYIDQKMGYSAKKLYIGDYLLSDNYACISRNPSWDTINILEELEELESEKDWEGINYQEVWGSFFYDKVNEKTIETFWPEFVRKNSSACFPSVSSQSFKDFIKFK